MNTLTHDIKVGLRPHFTLENGVLIVALLIAAALLWNTMQALQKNFQLQQQVDLMRQEVDLTGLENETLAYQQKYYQSAEYLELSARQRLNKAAPGEKVVILPPAPAQPATADSDKSVDSDPTNFEQWLQFFFSSDDRSQS